MLDGNRASDRRAVGGGQMESLRDGAVGALINNAGYGRDYIEMRMISLRLSAESAFDNFSIVPFPTEDDSTWSI